MSVDLGWLYHWSPKDNREAILQEGLTVLSENGDDEDWRAPYICLGTTPSSAWGLLPPRWPTGSTPTETMDLWQVRVQEGDQITIRGDHAPMIREVRAHHSLPPDRVWWAGERTPRAHETLSSD